MELLHTVQYPRYCTGYGSYQQCSKPSQPIHRLHTLSVKTLTQPLLHCTHIGTHCHTLPPIVPYLLFLLLLLLYQFFFWFFKVFIQNFPQETNYHLRQVSLQRGKSLVQRVFSKYCCPDLNLRLTEWWSKRCNCLRP